MVSKDPREPRYKSLQKCVAEIFENVGYCVDHWPSNEELHFELELIRDGIRYAFALKESRTVDVSDNGVMAAANNLLKSVIYPLAGRTPILVIIGVVSNEVRDQLAVSFPKLVVVDVQNLLYMVQANQELRSKLVTQLLFSVESVKAIEPGLPITLKNAVESRSIWDEYIEQIQAWKSAKKTSKAYSKAYEDKCCEMLRDLFADSLTGWWKQESSDTGLFRMDMIAKIKHGIRSEFWETAERHFNSKYVVFEYKNYSKKITQAQIFTTVKYLYAKALRTVAIIISPDGPDKNAQKAIRGCLREDGKLVLPLDHSDLITMLAKKRDGEDPSDRLCEILDAMLIDLEK